MKYLNNAIKIKYFIGFSKKKLYINEVTINNLIDRETLGRSAFLRCFFIYPYFKQSNADI